MLIKTRKMRKIMWLICLLLVVGFIGWLSTTPESPRRPTAIEAKQPIPMAAEPNSKFKPDAQSAPTVPAKLDRDTATIDELFPDEDSAWAWAEVDLEAIQTELPNNLYWETSAPTDDPLILDKREQIRAYWNKMYGKVLSNTGTETEVRDYYQHRNRVSSDHVEFTTYLIDHYSDVLPERDLRLIELARTLHLARLEQLPRDLAMALERRDIQEQARKAWLAGEAEFQNPGK